MRQKKVEGEYQPDSWPKRPWTKAMPPRTTRYCDGPRVPNRSMVGTRLTTPHDPSFAGRTRIVPRRINNGVQNHEFARVLDGLRDDLADRRPPGLGCQCQRHRGMGKSALGRIWAGGGTADCQLWTVDSIFGEAPGGVEVIQKLILGAESIKQPVPHRLVRGRQAGHGKPLGVEVDAFHATEDGTATSSESRSRSRW